MKTSELIGPALDWAVAKCEGKTLVFFDEYFIRNGVAAGVSQCRANSMLDFQPLKGKWCWLNSLGGGVAIYDYSTDWSQGGPIIEREEIGLDPVYCNGEFDSWRAAGHDLQYDENGEYIDGSDHMMYGPTPLIAAMRCYCASKLGDEVEIPEELK